MMLRLATVLCVLASCVERPPAQPPIAPPLVEKTPGLSMRDGDLWLTTESGEEKNSRDLIGSSLELDELSVRIDGVKKDPRSGRTLLVVKAIAKDGKEAEYCTPDPDGERLAVPIEQVDGQIDLLCTSGAVAKCARWGYPPGTPKSATIKQQLHEACVRMVRADYGGDGKTHTRDGTLIAFCDKHGVHPCDDDALPIEAAWAPTGAVCVAKTRVPSIISLKQLAASYPQLTTGSACIASSMRSDARVLLFSRLP